MLVSLLIPLATGRSSWRCPAAPGAVVTFLQALSIVVLDDLFNTWIWRWDALGGKYMQKAASWVNIKQQYWNFKRYTLWS